MKNLQKLVSPHVSTGVAKMLSAQVAGHIALDFCNTAGEHLSANPKEYFGDWDSVVLWLRQTGLIAADGASELLKHPAPLRDVIAFRERLYAVALAFARSTEPPRAALDELRHRAAAERPSVAEHSGRLYWKPHPANAWPQLCAVIAGEALALFCSDRAMRIGLCEGGECGWLFVDESRGKKRRWCAMNDCGAKAKARRYYLHRKEDRP